MLMIIIPIYSNIPQLAIFFLIAIALVVYDDAKRARYALYINASVLDINIIELQVNNVYNLMC